MIEEKIIELEKEWLELQPRPSQRELLEIFPEAKPYLKEKLKDYRNLERELAREIIEDLKRIYKKKTDKFTIWFLEKIVEVWKGEKLNWLNKKIRELHWVLYPKKTERGVSREEIERAENYPFKDLVGTEKNFILCPFHKEKKPSFYIKNNWAYCFACGWHGNTIKFLMGKNKISFIEAVKFLQ